MSEKIGRYTEDEILEHLTEGEGRGFLGRSMYDAIFDKIHALITENQQLKERIRIENNHPFIKPFVDKLPYVIVRNDKKLQLDEKSFDYLIKVEQQRDLYKKVIEEVREYIEREDICIDIRDNELNYISTNELLQILDKGESNE